MIKSKSPLATLLEAEQAILTPWLGRVFGYYCLSLGSFSAKMAITNHSRVQHCFFINEQLPLTYSQDNQCKALLHQLPIASDSIDLVVLLHQLEFSAYPHQVLREIERILIPEGRLIIAGLNPWSFFGRRWAHTLLTEIPQQASKTNFISQIRIKDWLQLLGFEIEKQHRLICIPPFHNNTMMHYLAPIDKALLNFFPALSSLYLIQAKKKISTLTPIKPLWQSSPNFAKTASQPSPVNRHNEKS